MKTLRWGIVGTGGIANSMAGMIKMADAAEIGAVSSRRMATAQEFAQKHDVANAFDSWQEMIDSDAVDAIYIATPTSVREEICIAAANGRIFFQNRAALTALDAASGKALWAAPRPTNPRRPTWSAPSASR